MFIWQYKDSFFFLYKDVPNLWGVAHLTKKADCLSSGGFREKRNDVLWLGFPKNSFSLSKSISQSNSFTDSRRTYFLLVRNRMNRTKHLLRFHFYFKYFCNKKLLYTAGYTKYQIINSLLHYYITIQTGTCNSWW